jgi:acyl-ACP thioesterase
MTPRRYTSSRRVRLGDVSPKGRLRLDAVARYLQDVAGDDGHDAIGGEADPWVVRRTTIAVERFPLLREPLTLTTWASASGARWAERRTAIVGDRGGRIETAALWVYVDLDSGRPKKLTDAFWQHYGESVGDRKVHARLTHRDAPPDGEVVPWPVRFSDFDVLGHVNNAVYWAVVEEHLDLSAPVTIEMEYRGGIDRGQVTEVATAPDSLWIVADGAVAASARITPERL